MSTSSWGESTTTDTMPGAERTSVSGTCWGAVITAVATTPPLASYADAVAGTANWTSVSSTRATGWAKVRVDECHRCSPVVEPQVTTEVVAVGPFRSRVCTLRSPTTRGLASWPTASNVTHRRSRQVRTTR